MKKYLYYIVTAIILSAALNTSCKRDDDKTPDGTLETFVVSLTAGDGKVTLAPQTAATGFAFYYAHSGAEAAAPTYEAVIASISGATAYTAETDISGDNGTAIYVQVYKVATADNTIVGFGQANATPEAVSTEPFEGAGTSDDPYRITSAADLAQLRDFVNDDSIAYRSAYYRQTANIDLSAVANWTPIGNTTTSRFRGVYDGYGYSISNLTVNGVGYAGLFGYLSNSSAGITATVRNVALINANIHATGSGARVGGIVSINFSGIIENCYVTGSVSSSAYAGGIVQQNSGTVRNCYTTCSVTGNSSQTSGIAGSNTLMSATSGVVQNCYAAGSVTSYSGAGGIVESNYGNSAVTTERCVALNPSVRITWNTNYVGRVVGDHIDGILSNNYGRSDMVLQNNYNGSSGTDVPVTSDLNGKHGFTISSTQWHSAIWWSGTAQFSTDNWDLANGRLPHLRTTHGGAFSTAQNPTVQ